ncbi:MAG: 50S ribosomal protein L11 methyltransferase [Lachnospiraceae bacterium]|nr:50S ribosomal protein L11 methyltransferase [Lachnospiraceae bacterium]
MKWKKFTITTTTAATDFLSEALSEMGVEGIEIEDHIPLTDKETKGMFIDILPDLGPDDGTARISFYLDEDVDEEPILEGIRKELEDIRLFVDTGAGTIEKSETEDKDWINNWKQYFHPFTVDNVLIKPTWEEMPEDAAGKMVLEIDPGTAFGTGSHETTQLCLKALQKYVTPGCKVLDVGTGSGILGIAAIKLGAESAFGTDLDENAVQAAIENTETNGIPAERFPVILGNLIDDPAVQEAAGFEAYDLVTANILAPVILMLQGEVAVHMKKGAVIISSGIIDTKEAEVVAAFEKNPAFRILEVNHQGEWVSVIARKE